MLSWVGFALASSFICDFIFLCGGGGVENVGGPCVVCRISGPRGFLLTGGMESRSARKRRRI